MNQSIENETETELYVDNEFPPFDGQVLKHLTGAGLNWLRTNHQMVNTLNVFPVPDGDTGTNMLLTMQAAYDEVEKSPERNVGKMAHAIAQGALMGARGNSGVILSQLWRGIARALDSQEVLDGSSLVRALNFGRDTAYKGVVRPVEGTILTVTKDIAAAANEIIKETQNPYEIIDQLIQPADESVRRTPELLSVLKEAGVVDAGGKGLFFILEGMMRYNNNLPLDAPVASVQPLAAMKLENMLQSIEAGQDYEIIVDFRPNEPIDLASFYSTLEQIGTSIQVGEGEGIYRMHIHVPTEKRYEPIDYAMSLGTITKVSMENLIAQMEDIEKSGDGKLNLTPVEAGQIAVVAVVPGSGIARVFASLGVAAIVEGGQTMNPSTQEILDAIENLPTEHIIILPNNKNIILAAEAASQLTVKNVAVVRSVSVPQGLSAMMRLIPYGEFDNVVNEMVFALDEVETGEITIATRSVEIESVECLEGEFIALLNGKLILSASNLKDACLGLLKKAHADHFELITLFYGVDTPRTEVNDIVDLIRKEYPNQDIEVQEGGQPHYHFIISIE